MRAGKNLTISCTFKSLQFYFNIVINISFPTSMACVMLLSWKSTACTLRPESHPGMPGFQLYVSGNMTDPFSSCAAKRKTSGFLDHSPMDQQELQLRNSAQEITLKKLTCIWTLVDSKILDLEPDTMIRWDFEGSGRVWGCFEERHEHLWPGGKCSKLSAKRSIDISLILVPL